MRIRLAVSVLLMVVFQLFFATTGEAQSITSDKVTIGLKDESLETAIKKIEQQSHFTFYYRKTDISALSRLNLTLATRTIEQTLKLLLQNTQLTFRQMDDNILLEQKDHKTTSEIKGRVLNKLDQNPVAGASVFLSNATVGGTTNSDGTFALSNIKPGKYGLIVSIVGFETYMTEVAVDNSCKTLPDIEISPKTIVLKEISVNAKADPEREKNYEAFKEEFLGTSELASECKILNPEVLDLNYDKPTGTLTASAGDFLKIENKALGYNLKYLLTDFVKINGEKSALKVQYSGSAFFEEMRGTPAQERRWLKKRLEVYEGSAMHFLRSGLNNSLDQEGFRALQIANTPNPKRPAQNIIDAKIKYYEGMKNKSRRYRDTLAYWRVEQDLQKTFQTIEQNPLAQADIIKLTNQKGLYALSANNGALYIMFNKKRHFETNNKLNNRGEPFDKESTILNFDIPYVLFDKNGGIINPDCVSFIGAWGKSRVAELLPVDYDPGQTVDTNADNILQNNQSLISLPRPASLKAELLKIKQASDNFSAAYSPEKPYLQFDKPYYSAGDTAWFKAYLLNGSTLMASDKSAFLYIDIANDSNKVVKRYSIPVKNEVGGGNISLDEKEFYPGTYTVCAYTNWMRNFENDYFYHKTFYITGPGEKSWLINKQVRGLNNNNNPVANIELQLSGFERKPAANIPLKLDVYAGNKRLQAQTVNTDQNGLVKLNIKFPEKASDLIINAESIAGDKRALIPVSFNRYENTDVQFLPEGGNLVSGLTAHIGFKAIGEDGKGVNLSGIIVDGKQNQATKFKSLHNGIGSFNLDIKDTGNYMAKVTLPDGRVKEYPLPAAQRTGTVLQIKNLRQSDSLAVSVQATNDVVTRGDSYFLIGKSRGTVCYAAVMNFRDNHFINRNIAKSLFPTGITHFTLMTVKGRPLNERLVYVDHGNLNIQLIPGRPHYDAGDSIALKIKVTGNTGQPVEGNFSLAVTDDALVKTDTLNSENILARMLLTSDLKGYVEQPGYYFSSKSDEAATALDNLLITQGWIGYDWRRVFNPPPINYQPEHDFEVKGIVLNVFNKPVKGTDVLLFSKSPAMLMDTITDKNGKFVFDHFPRADTPIFVIKAVNKKGGSYNVGITIDETAPPDFVMPSQPRMLPWYVNSDSTLINYTKSNALAQQQEYYKAKGHLLKEVNIKEHKIVKGSQNLNGPGEADIVLDEKDMEAAGKKTWLKLLQENIKDLRVNYRTAEQGVTAFSGNLPVTIVAGYKPAGGYRIKDKTVYFVIDGILLDRSLLQILAGVSIDPVTCINYYLTAHNAEDIKGIEVNYSSKYNDIYGLRYSTFDAAFIEITTRSGGGPWVGNTPGMYLYKPLALTWPKQFYKPKYMAKDTAGNRFNFRSTVDWEPNVNTDARGEATVSFYAAGKPSVYSLIVEGTDMDGNLGFKSGKIQIGENSPVKISTTISGK